jgi:hypothetical protein
MVCALDRHATTTTTDRILPRSPHAPPPPSSSHAASCFLNASRHVRLTYCPRLWLPLRFFIDIQQQQTRPFCSDNYHKRSCVECGVGNAGDVEGARTTLRPLGRESVWPAHRARSRTRPTGRVCAQRGRCGLLRGRALSQGRGGGGGAWWRGAATPQGLWGTDRGTRAGRSCICWCPARSGSARSGGTGMGGRRAGVSTCAQSSARGEGGRVETCAAADSAQACRARAASRNSTYHCG